MGFKGCVEGFSGFCHSLACLLCGILLSLFDKGLCVFKCLLGCCLSVVGGSLSVVGGSLGLGYGILSSRNSCVKSGLQIGQSLVCVSLCLLGESLSCGSGLLCGLNLGFGSAVLLKFFSLCHSGIGHLLCALSRVSGVGGSLLCGQSHFIGGVGLLNCLVLGLLYGRRHLVDAAVQLVGRCQTVDLRLQILDVVVIIF